MGSFLKQLFSVKLTDYRDTDAETVGTLRFESDGKVYRWVRNSTGGALTPNRIYYFGTTNTAGYKADQEVFTLGQAGKGTGINLMAGAAMSAIPDGQFGWLQCQGVLDDGPVEGTVAVAATDNLKGVNAQTYLVKDTAAGTAPTNRKGAIALAAQGGGAGVADTAVYLNCL
jgi:hypothetical protein